jgi:hypothetical protein
LAFRSHDDDEHGNVVRSETRFTGKLGRGRLWIARKGRPIDHGKREFRDIEGLKPRDTLARPRKQNVPTSIWKPEKSPRDDDRLRIVDLDVTESGTG